MLSCKVVGWSVYTSFAPDGDSCQRGKWKAYAQHQKLAKAVP